MAANISEERTQRVLQAINDGARTRREIQKKTGLYTSAIHYAMHILVRRGLILDCGRQPDGKHALGQIGKTYVPTSAASSYVPRLQAPRKKKAESPKPEKYKGKPAGKIIYPGYVYGASRLY